MSHAAVLVITKEKPTDEVLQHALQPFHEYESTGVEDEFVIDVDVTDKLRKDFTKHGKVGETFAHFVEYWSGAEPRDGRYFRRTNPNARWDWWQVGGRFSGLLRSFTGGTRGSPGAFGPDERETRREGVDICQRKDLDLESMYSARREERVDWLEEAREKTGLTVAQFEQALIEHEAGVKAWQALPDPRPRGGEFFDWLSGNGFPNAALARNPGFWDWPELNGKSLQEYINSTPAFQTYALLHNGEWHERGTLGWFGMSSNEKEPGDWEEEFGKLIKDLDPEAWLTVVDYHI